MNFTKDSKELLKQLDQVDIGILFKEKHIEKNKRLGDFCKKIIELYKSIEDKEFLIEPQTITIDNIRSLLNSRIISLSLLEEIDKINRYELYTIRYKQIKIILRVGGLKLTKKKLILVIKTILLMCLFSGKNLITLDINLFLTDVKKVLGHNGVLTPNEINTGYTNNNYIVIFRKEEFIKVLIHELIHKLKIDVSGYNNFPIEFSKFVNIGKGVKIKINEAYVETISCLINCVVCSYTIGKSELCMTYIDKELKFGLYQVAKILLFYGYKNADDFFVKYKGGKFRQKTSVFSYYIIKTSFIFNIINFIKFLSDISLKNYIELIKESLNNKTFIHHVDLFMGYIKNNKQKKRLGSTLRMSIIEI